MHFSEQSTANNNVNSTNTTSASFVKSAGGITLFSLLGISGFSGLIVVAKKLLMGEGLSLNFEGVECTLECGDIKEWCATCCKRCSGCCNGGDKEEEEKNEVKIRLTFVKEGEP